MFIHTGKDWKKVKEGIHDVIIKELITVEPPIMEGYDKNGKNQDCCFELYGFDIMLDSDLKPWLLEVNISPSFSSSSPFDKTVKTKLACDFLTLVGVNVFDHEKNEADDEPKIEPRIDIKGKLMSSEELEEQLVKEIQAIDIEKPTDYEVNLILKFEEESKRQGGF